MPRQDRTTQTSPTRPLRAYLWALPGSLLGLPLALTARRRRRTAGIVVAEGADWPRRVRWRYRAITLGHVVLSVDELDEQTLRHELVHVGQWERWGPLFLILYPLASLLAWLRGGDAYRDNVFEKAARCEGRDRPPDTWRRHRMERE